MWCKITLPITAFHTTSWVKRRPSSIKSAKMLNSRGGRRWIVVEALQGKGLGLRRAHHGRAWTKTHLQRNINAENTQKCEEFTHCNAATKASGEPKQSCQKFSTTRIAFVQAIAPEEEWTPSSEMDTPNGQFGHVISSWHQPNVLKSRHVHGDSIHNYRVCLQTKVSEVIHYSIHEHYSKLKEKKNTPKSTWCLLCICKLQLQQRRGVNWLTGELKVVISEVIPMWFPWAQMIQQWKWVVD